MEGFFSLPTEGCCFASMLANISSTHVKSPQALGLQKASPELGDRPWWLSLYHRFPRTELLVLQPLSPELHKLFETELLVRRVPSHCLFLNVQPAGSYNDTMEDTSPAGKCTNEEEKRGRRTKYGAPSTGGRCRLAIYFHLAKIAIIFTEKV